jgi:hypothetical protein
MARLFTVSEADALLPRLRRDFADVHQLRADAQSIRAELNQLEARGQSNGKDLAAEIREHQTRLEELAAKAQSILESIVALDCEIKDVEQGLVDFPSDRNGRTVYLCWKLGEKTIEYWHELSAGFAGRQRL